MNMINNPTFSLHPKFPKNYRQEQKELCIIYAKLHSGMHHVVSYLNKIRF